MESWSLDDTIVALSTARGPAAIAVVRVSGRATAALVSRVLGPDAAPLVPRRATLASVYDPLSGDLIDRSLVTWFPGPASFTGEDSAEIGCHGGPLVPRLVVDAFLAAGARLALPGEFTRRALLNGKLDLLEAEAILDLIEGSSPAMHRAAILQVEGGLSRRITEARTKLVELSALIAYGIDFPDEDEPPVPLERILAYADQVGTLLRNLLGTVPHGELLRDGALIVLAGRPNSGKSSLFNALCGHQRALVTDIPGTTRDAIEAHLSIEGYPVRLVDTAGLREADEEIESLGIEVARRYIAGADLVIVCVDSTEAIGSSEMEFIAQLEREFIIVRTKSDLRPPSGSYADTELSVSVRSGDGLERVRAELAKRIFGGLEISAEAPVVTRERHARALQAALREVETFRDLLDGEGPPEIAGTHLTGAVDRLDDLIGRVDQEDVLDAVFSNFCVGK